MKELDCKILTRAVGKCWHEHDDNGTCVKCGSGIFRLGGHQYSVNRSFTTPDDWELVRVATIMVYWAGMDLMGSRLSHAIIFGSCEQRCQLVADWIKTNPEIDGKHPFEWVTKMMEEKP